MEIDLSITYLAVIFGLGFIGSFISGMLGVGGSIIKYPMLLYIPPLFGLAVFTAHEVSGISAVQVLFASIAGVWAYRKSGLLNKDLIIYMGASILVGSFIGSYGSGFLSEDAVNIVYGMLAVIAAVMMFIPRKQLDETAAITFNKPLAAGLALVVGVASGIVGAAGGFLLVPILLTVLKNSHTCHNRNELSNYVYFINWWINWEDHHRSSRVLAGIYYDYCEYISGTTWGKIGQKMNVKVLQWLLAIMIGATAIKIWFDILL